MTHNPTAHPTDEATPSDFVAVMQQVADVEGWMSLDQAGTLHDAAARCPADGRIVEIGSFQGRSTIVLASAAVAGAEVIAIDPHAGNDRGPQEIDGFGDEANSDHDAFNTNLAAAGVADRVRHLRKFSNDALADVPGDIDVLYIDGAHRFGPARADIQQWGAKVVDGGTMLIHDSFSSVGVTGAIMSELLFGGRFRYVRRSRSLAVYRAKSEMSSKTRVANALRQLAQLPWFVKNLLLKALLSIGLGKLFKLVGRPAPEWPY